MGEAPGLPPYCHSGVTPLCVRDLPTRWRAVNFASQRSVSSPGGLRWAPEDLPTEGKIVDTSPEARLPYCHGGKISSVAVEIFQCIMPTSYQKGIWGSLS